MSVLKEQPLKGILSTSQTPLYVNRSGKCFNNFFIAAGVRLVKCMAEKRGYPLAMDVNTSMWWRTRLDTPLAFGTNRADLTETTTWKSTGKTFWTVRLSALLFIASVFNWKVAAILL